MTKLRGRSENDWAEALLQQCQEAELTVKVPAGVPLHTRRLYATLGVGVEVDETLPPWRPVRSGPRKATP